ncbi:MAG: glycosyltransferase family 1 protein [Candidatus Hydrogenedentes bacterium]|nr:glycosyltransferase family 1 protein [Candidatus Hydrogenedentota bacterium]
MNVLAMGIAPWGDRAHLNLYRSACGHEVRLLAMTGDADYFFTAGETAAHVVQRISADWPPDLLLCGCPEVYPPPRAIEHCPIQTAAIISDWNLYQPQLEHNLSRFDVVLSDRMAERALRVWGAQPRFVQPLYSHRTLVHRPLGMERDIDILFLGNLNHAIHRARGKVLEMAGRLSDDYRVVIDEGHPPEAYARGLNRARVAVNYAVRHEMNLRCFEAPACGALLFLEAENLEARDYLTDGGQAVFYRAENLEALLRACLEDEPRRAAMARVGQERIADLAIERRLDDLFNWIAAQPRAPRAFLDLPGTARGLADVLMYGSSFELEQRAMAAALLAKEMESGATAAHHMAAGCMLFEEAALSTSEDRPALVRACVDRFQEAALAAPHDAAPWYNLAIVARQAGAGIAELECLGRVLEARQAALGAFVLGKVSDPYYAAWRLALGHGRAAPQLLRAAAAARLAECALERGDAPGALDYAGQSIALCAGMGAPYRWAAAAHTRLGRLDEAARLLETGLPHTAFDAEYRRDLVQALRAAGRETESRARALESARIFQACPRMQAEAELFRGLAAGTSGFA